MNLDGTRPAPAVLVAASVVAFALLESLRVWFPSLLFVLGDAGSTSAVALGAFALACLGVATLAASLIGRLSAATLWWAGSGALVLGRSVLVVELAGPGRLVASTLAVVGASTAVVALAGAGVVGRTVRVGILIGLAIGTCVHAGTRTLGLVWPTSTVSIVASVAVVLALVLTTVRTARVLGERTAGPQNGSGAAWPWLVLTPLLVLLGMVSGVPGRTAAATGWPAATVAATVAGAHLTAVFAALLAGRLGPARSGVLAAAGLTAGTAAALDASGWSGVIGQITLAIGLGLLVGSDIGADLRPASDRRRAVTAGLAILAFGLVSGVYYAAYDLRMPFDNQLLLMLTALFGSGLALVGLRVGRPVRGSVRLDLGMLARTLIVGALTVAVVALGARVPDSPPVERSDPERVRVAQLNVRFGFDLDGRFAAKQQAEILRGHAPDVVVLNEVDRGWLASGGHDALTVIAEELGLPHVLFSRAADEIWGNALLSRFPITERASELLPWGVDPMGRSQLAAVLTIDDEQQLGVVGTHLSHLDDQGETRLPQVRAVAATVAILRERGVPTVVLGDLNAEPGSAELATLETLVTDVLPPGTLTYPADQPTVHIDHVLASPELRRTGVALPEVVVSDHRPVIVELEFRSP